MGVRKFAEIVAAKSGAKMQVKAFPSNQLGSEHQQTSALQGGAQEMQSPATTSLVGIVKDYGAIDFPFTVTNHAQAFSLLDGPLGTALLEKLPEKGLVGLAYWDLGFRNVTNSKRSANATRSIPASGSPRAWPAGRTVLPTPRPAESRGRSGPDPPP